VINRKITLIFISFVFYVRNGVIKLALFRRQSQRESICIGLYTNGWRFQIRLRFDQNRTRVEFTGVLISENHSTDVFQTVLHAKQPCSERESWKYYKQLLFICIC